MIDPLPSDIFRPGQVLNNTYEIEGVLGRGGTGEVYLARNQVTGRVFAIKALNAQFSANEDYLELMKREEEMRAILHPAVVRYNECSRTDDGHVYLVMDYIKGVSLAEAMVERRIDPRELLIVAHRVAEGLVETHRHGIVHRDLSPDNIILRDGKPEEATIIDFGIAKDTATDARTIVGNEFAGKYEYAAPEQLDGHSEPRTDLYALGATLLAAWAGETPFLGTTPGEIVRRKQRRLDTERVPEPLKGLIEALTEPQAERRPASAEAVVAMIDGLLKPSGRTDRPRKRSGDTGRAPRRGVGLLALLSVPAVLAVAAFGAWTAGLFDGIAEEPLPVASPFTLTAAHTDAAAPAFSAHAPNADTAAILANAFTSATGAAPGPDAVTIADGMPLPEWAELAAELLGRAGTLEDWTLAIEDTSVSMAGIAPDRATRDALASGLDDFAAGTGMSVRYTLRAGPRMLSRAALEATVADYATCGPLRVDSPDTLALGETVVITGDFVRDTDVTALENTVAPLVGDRPVRVQGAVLNEELCRIRAVLPPTPPANLSVWLGNGVDESPNLTGIFRTGENPVVEVHAPASIDDGYLWVMVVDNKGLVYHIVPNINDPEQRIARMGRVEGGVRRIRVLHPVAALAQDPALLAIRVDDGNFGKSEIIAILSREPLFDMRRPRDESVGSVAEALTETLEGRSDVLIGVAARIIDARP